MRPHAGKYGTGVSPPRFMPPGIAEARARLSGLQINPRLSPYVREEISECDETLRRLVNSSPGPDTDQQVREAAAQVEQTVALAQQRYRNAISFKHC